MNERELITEKPQPTHGCGCKYVGKDGIKRSMEVHRYSDGTIGAHISTYWDGDDKEPITTSVRMGVEAYSVLLDMLNAFALDRDRFRIADAAVSDNAEPRLVSYAVDGSTCTLKIDGVEYYYKLSATSDE